MITTKFFLDARQEKPDNRYNIYVRVTNNRKSFLVNTGVKTSPEYWDGSSVIKEPNARVKNMTIRKVMDEIDRVIYNLDGEITNDALKKLIKKSGDEVTFIDAIEEFISTKSKPGTYKVYIQTKGKVLEYEGGVTFSRMTYDWLTEFEKHLLSEGYSINYVSIQMRNIRAVFNYAIDQGYTTLYPFRKFKIKKEQTAKRSLSVEEVRRLMNYPCEEYQKKYRDIFILMIYMIGINSVDLLYMPPVKGNRISYKRRKTDKETSTNVRLIEFTLQPEAQEIIKKYAGKKYMLDVMDTYHKHIDFLHRMNIGLQKIGELQRVGRGGKKIIEPAFPGISSYWARHTWATLAAQLDVPKETIAAALGHAGNSVTDIYIDFDRKKIDEANRKVIDYIKKA